MAEYKLSVELRPNTSKHERKRLRRVGKIPGIYYSPKEQPIPIAVDYKELHSAFSSGSHIFDLKIGDNNKKCIVREVQHDVLTESIIHVDFLGVTLQETVHVPIPVHIKGTAIGVKEFGGVLEQHLWELEVKCQVANIPDDITIDVSELNIGDSIHVGDITMENVEILVTPETSIVSVVKPTGAKLEEEELEEEELEEEEGEEGEKEEEKAEQAKEEGHKEK